MTGTVRVPVLPLFYSNVGIPGVSPSTRLQEILFDGPNPPDGTVTDYYDEVSYGLLNLTGDVFAYTGVPGIDTYYEGGTKGLYPPARTGELIRDVLDAADPGIDFSQYDNDGPDGTPNSGDDDGVVDMVTFLTPETGGECGPLGTNLNMWAHRGNYFKWPAAGGGPYTTDDPASGGGFVRIDDYTVQSALNCGGGEMDIGTFAHEVGHIFGLPDLYDTDNDSQGLGYWSLMAAGSWNTQSSPAHMSAWEKAELGWLTPTQLVGSHPGLSLSEVEFTPEAHQIFVGNGESFLLENRQPLGFDQHLKTCGLAIYHVDQATTDLHRQSNSVNQKQNCGIFVQQAQAHYGIALEQADGLCQLEANGNRGDAGDLFPGSTSNMAFGPTTNPDSDSYAPAPTSVSATNISACASTMTADVEAAVLPDPGSGAVDVLFLIDMTGSYLDDFPNIQSQMPGIVAALQATFSNIRFALATFKDFPFSPFGDPTDYAYQLELPLTYSGTALVNAVNGLPPPSPFSGADLPESQYEAVHQTLTGLGRDLDGNTIPGDSVGEVAPTSVGWSPARHRVVYLHTDAPFHDSDVENYPGAPLLPAAGRNGVRALIASTYPPSALTLFTLVSDHHGVYVSQGQDGSVPDPPENQLVTQSDELGELTGGGVLFVGPDSSDLSEIIDVSISVLEQSDITPPGVLLVDGFESGDTSAWTTTVP